MANSLLGLSFATPVAATSTVTSEANHPAENVLTPTKWLRTYRGTGNTLDIDLGTATSLAGIYLNRANFSGVQFSASATQGAGTNLYSSTQTLPPDLRVNRRKGLFLSSGAPAGTEGAGLVSWSIGFSHRWLRITMSTITDGSGVYELGAVALLPSITTMPRNWATPFRWTPLEAVTRLPYASGGSEANIEGPLRLAYDLEGPPWTPEIMSLLLAVQNLGQDGPLCLYENRGNIAHAYLVKRTAEIPFGEEYRRFSASFRFEECI